MKNSFIKKSLAFAVAFLCCFLCFGKSKQGKKAELPVWCSSPYALYPQKEFFAASGSAKNKAEAEIRAIETLAGIFGRDVHSENQAQSFMSKNEKNGESAVEISSTLSSRVLTEIDQRDLIGIEIAESFFDAGHNEWYVLAVINKERTGALYENLVERNLRSIAELVEAAEKLPDSFSKIAYFSRAMKLAGLNESYAPRFEVIHPQKFNLVRKKFVSSDSLRIKRDNAAEKIPVSVSVSGCSDDSVLTSCEAVLKGFGIKISDRQFKYRLQLDVARSFRTVQNPPIVYCEYSLSAKMTDKNNSVLMPWTASGRAGGKNEKLAEDKAVLQIKNAVQNDYGSAFSEFLYGEIK